MGVTKETIIVEVACCKAKENIDMQEARISEGIDEIAACKSL